MNTYADLLMNWRPRGQRVHVDVAYEIFEYSDDRMIRMIPGDRALMIIEGPREIIAEIMVKAEEVSGRDES